MFRLMAGGLVLETLSTEAPDGEWVDLPNPLEWDGFHEAVTYGATEASYRVGQDVEVIDEEGRVIARVSCPVQGLPQGAQDALRAPLALQEGFEA